jgi:enoyl-CoA hydratase/carnithine racemase
MTSSRPSRSPSNASAVQVRVDGPCGTILIKSPDRCNALSRAAFDDLQQAFDDLHQQPGVRAVTLTGHGPWFSAGTDLKEIAHSLEQDDPQQYWFADANKQRSLLTAMLHYPKPIIAAVNGPALGTGLALVTACDLVLAAPQASFGFPEAQRGLSAGVGIPLIAFRLGAGQAAHLLLRGHPIDAQEAHRVGLVHQIVPYDLLWAQARQWAEDISRSSSVALSITKRVLNETVGETLAASLATAAAATATARTTEHADEGVHAFLEKRTPQWPR